MSFPIFFPLLSSLLSTCYLRLRGFRAFVCFLFSSALWNWFVHLVWNALGQRGSVGTGFSPVAFVVWPKATGMRPVACGPHGSPPAPMLRSRASSGSDARHRSPDVRHGFAEYALFFPIHICLSFSLSLLFRQPLLYNSQFNISIRTQLISTQKS